MNYFRLVILLLAWGWSAFGLTASQATAGAPPNVLLITVDNLGFGDLRVYNPASEILTPRLDRFAAEGARLTNFYTASPTCSVSRACLLTGRIPQRHGLTRQLAGVAGNYGVGLPPQEVLLAELMRRAPVPYATGCFGKWNIGFAPGSRPTERGFDEFLGHASGNMDYYQHNYRERHDLYLGTEPLDRRGEYATDIFASAAIDFIRKNQQAKRPWFCYLPFNAPHFPVVQNKRNGEPNVWQAPDWAFEAYGLDSHESDPRKRYAAVVTALDQAIGRVLDALEQAGVSENTLVFFMSDNGAFRLHRPGIDVGDNRPLRSGGVTCYEGGLRVVAMARWPQHIQAGVVRDQVLWSPDLLIACCQIAKVELPSGVELDGRDPLPALIEDALSPHRSLYFQYREHQALRMGNWKIVRENPRQAWQLFDLGEDPMERKDRATQQPRELEKLTREHEVWRMRLERDAR